MLANNKVTVQPRTAATAAVLTGSGAADTDFSGGNTYSATLSVDGGAVQNILLNANYTNAAGLIAELNSQTADATWTQSTGTLTLTSDSTGTSSSLAWNGTVGGAKDLNVADGSDTGEADSGATLVFTGFNGTKASPQPIQFQIAESSPAGTVYFGGEGVREDEAPRLTGDATQSIPVIAGEKVYAVSSVADMEIVYVETQA